MSIIFLNLPPPSHPPYIHMVLFSVLRYPQDEFYGASVAPLLACVSLGPKCGIVIFNDLVIGGMLLGILGGLVKYIIERSKIAEIRNKLWGRAFWAFGHVVVNTIHRLHVLGRAVYGRISRRISSIFSPSSPSSSSFSPSLK